MIYLERTNPKFAGITNLPNVNYISKDEYVDFFYHIGSTYITPTPCAISPTGTIGVMPWDYKNGIMKISGLINVSSISNKPFRVLYINSINNPVVEENFLKEKIISSLKNNFPVTILYSIFSPYSFYKNQDLSGQPYEQNIMGGHYINITEFIIDNIAKTNHLKIASWGERFYTDFVNINRLGVEGAMFFYDT